MTFEHSDKLNDAVRVAKLLKKAVKLRICPSCCSPRLEKKQDSATGITYYKCAKERKAFDFLGREGDLYDFRRQEGI